MRFIAIGIAIVMLAGALAYRFVPRQELPLVNGNRDASATSTASAYDIDTDHDGVPDWEERLLGTDPNNALSVPSTTSMTSINGDASTTMTTALAHVMLQQYLLNTQGGNTDLQDPTALEKAIANSITIPTPTYHIYATGDITTVSNTQQNRSAYQLALQNALAPMNHGGAAEIALYTQAMGGDAAAKSRLQGIVNTYSDSLKAAARISVPSEAVIMHVNALNALGYYTATLRDLLANIDDPVGSLALLRAYNDAEQGVFASFTAVQKYIATHTTTS